MADEPRAPSRFSFRGLNRAIHRDLGNFCVGLTVVYAVSGLAVNHMLDWEPNYRDYSRVVELGGPVAGDDEAAAKTVLAKLHVDAEPRDVSRTDAELDIVLDRRTLHVDTVTGHVVDEGQEPRFFFRVANWLHLNRGKKAWTVVADSYAAGLLLLAFTGIFMMSGRKGILGRGGIFIALGAAVPILYVVWSGGPEKKTGSAPAPAADVSGR